MARAALLLAALLLAGCAAPPPPPEEPRPRAQLPPPQGPLEPGFLDEVPGQPTSADDLEAAVLALKASPRAEVTLEGHSVQGRPLLGVLVHEGPAAGKPTVFLTGSQHGDEPSGSDAALRLATYYAFGGDAAKATLGKLNLYVLVCANPDGRVAEARQNAERVDVNRDHMSLASPEAQAIHAAYHRVDPVVILDLHQFGAPPLDVPPTPVSSTVVFEVGSVQNPLAYPGIILASHDLEGRVLGAVQEQYGPGAASAYPVTESSQESSIHRNHYGMHNSLSLLFEARRPLPNYTTEVRLHVVAAQEVLRQVALDPQGKQAAKAEAEGESQRSPPPVAAYLAPPQAKLPQLLALLQGHGFNLSMSAATLRATAVHYGPSLDALRLEFPNGTLVAPTGQPDWRSLAETFESSSTKDSHYKDSPHDQGMDVWRQLRADSRRVAAWSRNEARE